MALINRNKSTKEAQNSSASVDLSVYKDLKSGNKQKTSDFIWSYLNNVYSMCFLASGSGDISEILTSQIFLNAFEELKVLNVKSLQDSPWQWILRHAVEVIGNFHIENSGSIDEAEEDEMGDFNEELTPMDMETTIILGQNRVKKCLASLTEEQQKVFVLRHQLELNYEQIAIVLNFSQEKVTNLLFKSRVQIVKCLGKG